MRKRYRLKKGVGPLPPKKNPKKDLRRYSSIFFLIGLSMVVWGFYYAFEYKTYEDSTNGSSGSASDSVVVSPNPNEGGDGTINILSLELEQIENLANTIAGQNAVWPGYRGDQKDHQAVQAHFGEQFAKFINSGIIPVNDYWYGKSVAFAYAVSDTGVIQFVSKIPGGTLQSTTAYVAVKEGISGKVLVQPAQDESGENIHMIYYIRVKFAERK